MTGIKEIMIKRFLLLSSFMNLKQIYIYQNCTGAVSAGMLIKLQCCQQLSLVLKYGVHL